MQQKFAITTAFALLITITSFAQTFNRTELPLFIPDRFIQPVTNAIDFQLQLKLSERLNQNARWRSLISQKKLAVGLVDLNDPTNIKYASVNGNEMMYAASLPKIAVLLAVADALDKGQLKETAAIKSDMRQMMSKSDNHATTRLIDLVGYKKIEEVLTNPAYDLYNKQDGGGLWVGKRYAAGGARYPDPMKGLSHAATVDQVCKFYYLMAVGKLVNRERSSQMLNCMAAPELHHKFVNTLQRVDPKAQLFRKSGSWENFHSDSVLVWGEGYRKYILVALTEDPEGEQIMRELVNAIEDVMRATNLQMATK